MPKSQNQRHQSLHLQKMGLAAALETFLTTPCRVQRNEAVKAIDEHLPMLLIQAVSDPALRDDAKSELYLSLLRARTPKTFETDKHAKRYLCRVLRNGYIKAKSKERKKSLGSLSQPTQKSMSSQVAASPEALLAEKRFIELLQREQQGQKQQLLEYPRGEEQGDAELLELLWVQLMKLVALAQSDSSKRQHLALAVRDAFLKATQNTRLTELYPNPEERAKAYSRRKAARHPRYLREALSLHGEQFDERIHRLLGHLLEYFFPNFHPQAT